MFRDPEHKVVGGVSGGVAAYFGLDLVLVRLLFIIFTIFFGVGIFIYIVLWIALPEAKTLTDRMEMQGEPVTLSNIESNIKKNLNVDPNKEESTATKILLLPFRVIGILLSVLGKILVPMVEVLRVAIGIAVVLVGLTLLFTSVVTAGAIVGVFSTSAFSWPWIHSDEISMPLQVFTNSVSGWLVFAAFIATLIPSVFVVILGASVIARKLIIGATAGWTMFVLFFVSLAILSVGIPKIIYSFKEDGEFKIETTYPVRGKTLVFQINEVGMDDYDAASLTLRGYNGTNLKLVQTFEAKGPTRQQAIENAKMVDYNVTAQDTIITFDSNVRFKDDAVFREQRLKMTLYIPYNFPFILDEATSRFITHYIDYDHLDGNTWIMTEDGIQCQTCPPSESHSDDTDDVTDDFGLRDFDELDLRGLFDVHIMRGEDYAVELIGDSDEKDKYDIYKRGKSLVIEYEGRSRDFDWDKMRPDMRELRLNVTMPNLDRIEAEGLGTIRFDEFIADNVAIDLRGPVKLRGHLNAHNLAVNLTGKAEAELSGQVNNLNADLEFASSLKAYNLEASDAIVEARGASSAKVNVKNSLKMTEKLAGDIDYRGDPHVTRGE